ncbi:RNA-directed DNA polymerase, eukaryota, partial [Tanacetum coccineum]
LTSSPSPLLESTRNGAADTTITATTKNHDDVLEELSVEQDMNLEFQMFTMKPEESYSSGSMLQQSSTSVVVEDPAEEIRVGNGCNTNFWKYLWIGDSRLCTKFPRLYALENNKDCTVAAKLSDDFASSYRREVRSGVESEHLLQLLDLLDTVVLSHANDRWVWDLNGTGSFQVSLNSLPTRINLTRRGVLVSPISCSICHAGLEDLDHLLFSCNLAIDISRSICKWWDLAWNSFDSYGSWLSWLNSIRMSFNLKKVLEGVFYTAWWSIWTYRNQLLFGDSHPRKDIIFDDIGDVGGCECAFDNFLRFGFKMFRMGIESGCLILVEGYCVSIRSGWCAAYWCGKLYYEEEEGEGWFVIQGTSGSWGALGISLDGGRGGV